MNFPEIKRLPIKSEIKDDLQTLYEAVQEIGYTEYSVLKLLERLAVYCEEIKKITDAGGVGNCGEQSYLLRDLKERTKDLGEGSEEISKNLEGLTQEMEAVLGEIKLLLARERCSDCMAPIAINSNLIVQASKQILAQNGFDPDTGIQNSQIDRDYKKLKIRVGDFAWSLLFAGISSLIIWFYAQSQKIEQRNQMETVVNQLNQEINRLKEPLKPNPKPQ